MKLIDSLRFNFLKWVSEFFNVTIIMATQQIKPKNYEPEIGKMYRFKSDRNPFVNRRHVKVIDKKGNYVQYALCQINGKTCSDPVLMSNDINTFNLCYTEVEES